MSETLSLIREAVAASGKSVRKLADDLGVNHSHLSRLLAGRVGIGASTVGRLMTLLDSKEGTRLLESYLRDEREKVLAEHVRASREKKNSSK
jgi:transcriptional regulator with XRE-family HTH domain